MIAEMLKTSSAKLMYASRPDVPPEIQKKIRNPTNAARNGAIVDLGNKLLPVVRDPVRRSIADDAAGECAGNRKTRKAGYGKYGQAGRRSDSGSVGGETNSSVPVCR